MTGFSRSSFRPKRARARPRSSTGCRKRRRAAGPQRAARRLSEFSGHSSRRPKNTTLTMNSVERRSSWARVHRLFMTCTSLKSDMTVDNVWTFLRDPTQTRSVTPDDRIDEPHDEFEYRFHRLLASRLASRCSVMFNQIGMRCGRVHEGQGGCHARAGRGLLTKQTEWRGIGVRSDIVRREPDSGTGRRFTELQSKYDFRCSLRSSSRR
jgi:hypothetical protein